MVDAVIAEFGTVDILINNAGITKDNLLMRMSEEDFDKVIDVNLKSVFNMTKAIQRTFLKKRAGSIINMSSVVGVKGNAGQTNYAASRELLVLQNQHLSWVLVTFVAMQLLQDLLKRK
jgi:3-oxoacyl-[acyl-carrier protein] reductase